MWKKSHTIITDKVTGSQMWKLFADVNLWHTWDQGIEYARLEGQFEKGSYFVLRPKGGPSFKVEILETIENKKFVDVTKFPFARMYFEHLFEDTGSGLKITNTISVTGPMGFFWKLVVAKKIAESFPTDMLHEIEAAGKL